MAQRQRVLEELDADIAARKRHRQELEEEEGREAQRSQNSQRQQRLRERRRAEAQATELESQVKAVVAQCMPSPSPPQPPPPPPPVDHSREDFKEMAQNLRHAYESSMKFTNGLVSTMVSGEVEKSRHQSQFQPQRLEHSPHILPSPQMYPGSYNRAPTPYQTGYYCRPQWPNHHTQWPNHQPQWPNHPPPSHHTAVFPCNHPAHGPHGPFVRCPYGCE